MSQKKPKGHRQRLRERFINDKSNFNTDEDLLELLLTYAIPRRDVKPIVKDLISSFGNLHSILDSSIETLCTIKGIKENSSVLIKLVGQIRKDYSDQENVKKSVISPVQMNLFADASNETKESRNPEKIKSQRKKVVPRKGTGMFSKAVLKESIQILPDLPETESLNDIRSFLKANLHYNSEQTRQRYAGYVVNRMFPDGYADSSLRQFSKVFANKQELRDVCFYRFLKAEPLEIDMVENLILPNIGYGRLNRNSIQKKLMDRYPESRSIKDCARAIVDALTAGGIAKADRAKLVFTYREILLNSFAFILHSEFPEPGIYDFKKLEQNRFFLAMLWRPDQFIPMLYELRNQGIISKVSEIDNIRQFTTKYSFDEGVDYILSKG